jgi:hypothetical protein
VKARVIEGRQYNGDRYTISLAPDLDVYEWMGKKYANGLYKKFAGINYSHLIPVTSGAPVRLLCEVETFAYYFKREEQYDFAQYNAWENMFQKEKDDCVAYLLIDNHRAVGAACFRWRDYTNYKGWALQWCWLHPYFRNKGILQRSWDSFVKTHGNFVIEGPYSKAMQAFMIKVGYKSPINND